jgi:hypothetical protein
MMELTERHAGGANKNGEAYWKFSLSQLQRNTIDLCVLATGTVSVPDLYAIVTSIAHSLEEVKSEQWRSRSRCFKYLNMADQRAKTSRQQHDFGLVADYFPLEMPALSEKTRSVIVSSFTSMVDLLNRGVLRELFCNGTNIDPTATENGKIIVVNLVELGIESGARAGGESGATWFLKIAPGGAASNTFWLYSTS